MKEKPWYFERTQSQRPTDADVYKLFEATDKDKQKVIQFYQHHPVLGYEIGSIRVIYNPNMNHKFALYLAEIQQCENNPAFKSKWQTGQENQHAPIEHSEKIAWRTKVHEHFKNLANPYQDSDYPAVNLLPMWHGTKAELVDSICRTGYANLATTDTGFFGKGIYGAHEAEYSYRVYATDNGKVKNGGLILLNWTAVFSAYPVIDGDKEKLEGKGNYGNYDAHFIPVVPVNPTDPNEANYYPTKPNQSHTYTELVVFQKAACLPRYLVQLQRISPSLLTPTPTTTAAPTWMTTDTHKNTTTTTLDNTTSSSVSLIEKLQKALWLAKICETVEIKEKLPNVVDLPPTTTAAPTPGLITTNTPKRLKIDNLPSEDDWYSSTLQTAFKETAKILINWEDKQNNYKFKLLSLKLNHPAFYVDLKIQTIYVFIANNLKEDIGVLDKLPEYYLKAIEQITKSNAIKLYDNSEVIFTGFSIAAGLAQIAGCYYQKTAITFESPGMKSALTQIGCFEKNSCIDNYLCVPNRVNTFGEQVGKMKRIYIPHVESTSNWHRAKAVLGELDRISTYLMPVMLVRSYFFKAATQEAVKLSALRVDKAAEILSSSTENANKLLTVVISQAEKGYKNMVGAHSAAQETLKVASTTLRNTSFFCATYQAVRQVRVISDHEKKELIDKGQHSISRIFFALKENEKEVASRPMQHGHIIEMQTWPTTLSKTMVAFFKDIGRSYLPFQGYNAGVVNINDENSYIEENVKLIEGYQPKL